MPSADYVVVGSGLTGATIARLLADNGREVVVLERRAHVGGNVHDRLHSSGIRVHTYGPHYFRTSSEYIWEYVTRFAPFYPFEARVVTRVDGTYQPWPVNRDRLRRITGGAWGPLFAGAPSNFEEACLAVMPRIVFDKFIKGYTEKQWGVSAASLGVDLARRIDVRTGDDTRLVCHRYQGLPVGGYEQWILRMLDNIPTFTNIDYLKCRSAWRHKRTLFFTGGVDEFFDYSEGALQYRGQCRSHSYHPDTQYVLPCSQVNEPDPSKSYVRLIEWKHMMEPSLVEHIAGTVTTSETPCAATNPNTREYPCPDTRNRTLYGRYAAKAASRQDVRICGRLGEYRYYDMDQAIGRAMTIVRSLLRKPAGSA